MNWPEKPGAVSALVLNDIKLKIAQAAVRQAFTIAHGRATKLAVELGLPEPQPDGEKARAIADTIAEQIKNAMPNPHQSLLEWADALARKLAGELDERTDGAFERFYAEADALRARREAEQKGGD